MIHWHPDETTLMEYSSGNLSTSYSICISAHLHYCSRCRSICSNLDTLGAAVLEDIETENVSASLLDDTLAMLDRVEPRQTLNTRAGKHIRSELPRAIAKLADDKDIDNIDWKWRWPKLRIHELLNEGNQKLSLYKISPGGKMPSHEHRGEELTLVLDGSFSDTYGTYNKGDIVVRHQDETHAPIASQSNTCVCLVLENATPFFSGISGKFINTAQRLFGGANH